MNLTDSIWRTSHAWPQRVAVIHYGRPVTYGELRQITVLVASRLVESGVARGDCIALALKTPLSYLVLSLAGAYLGAVTTGLAAGNPEAVTRGLLQRHGARWIVSDSGAVAIDVLSATCLDVKQLLAAAQPGNPARRAALAQDADDLPWVIALSSGTTGTPKSIAHNHADTLLNCILTPAAVHGAQAVVMVHAPMVVFMGLRNALRTLTGGGTLVIGEFAAAAGFFETVARDKPGRIYTSTGRAAALAAYAAKSLPRARENCASVEVITLSGAAASPALLLEVAQHICPNIEINYGSTEAGGIARATPETLAARPESAGRLYPWVQAQSVDEELQPLPLGQVGLLRFKTPAQAGAYVGDPQASARAFRAGWFYPGDTGSLDAGGYLTLAGRADQLLNLGGNKIDPAEIERVLDLHPAVLESGVIAAPSGASGARVLVAVVVLRDKVDEAVLVQWCRDRLNALRVPRSVLFAPSLPKNAGGKLMRDRLEASVSIKADPTQSTADEDQPDPA